MRAVKLLLCSALEMSEIDLLFRDALTWDPALEAKVLRVGTGDVAFKKVPSWSTGTSEHSQKAAWDHVIRKSAEDAGWRP